MITLIIVYIKKSAVRPEIPLTATTSNKTSSNTRETEKSLNVISQQKRDMKDNILISIIKAINALLVHISLFAVRFKKESFN